MQFSENVASKINFLKNKLLNQEKFYTTPIMRYNVIKNNIWGGDIMKDILRKIAFVMVFTICSMVIVNSKEEVSAQTFGTEFVKLDYTIEEIKSMSLGEFYSKVCPEELKEFSLEEQEELFNTPYPEANNNSRDLGYGTGTSSLWNSGTRLLGFRVTTQMNFSDGSKAKKIHISVLLYDSSGTTWMARTDSNTDSNYFSISGNKNVSSGRYRMETVHTVSMPSGYFPKTMSSTSYSSWVNA